MTRVGAVQKPQDLRRFASNKLDKEAGSFHYKTVKIFKFCNPPSQIFFILKYMKAIKK